MNCVLANPHHPWTPSDRFVTRIKKAYRMGVASLNIPPESMWHVIGGLTANLHTMLLSDGDDRELALLLANPRRSDLYYGMDNLCRTIMDGVLASSIESQSHHGESIAKSVRKLAEALGSVRVYNPEHQNVTDIGLPLEDLLQRIDAALGTRIRFPNPFPEELGIETSRGVACYRAIQAIYQARRVTDYSEGGRVVEIGGGVGRTAYYAHLFGVTDYVIVDIPMSLVGQACFLAATLGEDSIWLESDDRWLANRDKLKHRTMLLSPASLSQVGRASLAINVDSFTEMARAHAKAYIEYCMKHTPLLLSINHETNPFTVRELLPSKQKVYRHPYWMREGYVEEVVMF